MHIKSTEGEKMEQNEHGSTEGLRSPGDVYNLIRFFGDMKDSQLVLQGIDRAIDKLSRNHAKVRGRIDFVPTSAEVQAVIRLAPGGLPDITQNFVEVFTNPSFPARFKKQLRGLQGEEVTLAMMILLRSKLREERRKYRHRHRDVLRGMLTSGNTYIGTSRPAQPTQQPQVARAATPGGANGLS